MNLEELEAAQRELRAIAEAARRALMKLPEGSTMAKAATKALEAADQEARELQPFVDALAADADRVIGGYLDRNRERADAPNALRSKAGS